MNPSGLGDLCVCKSVDHVNGAVISGEMRENKPNGQSYESIKAVRFLKQLSVVVTKGTLLHLCMS